MRVLGLLTDALVGFGHEGAFFGLKDGFDVSLGLYLLDLCQVMVGEVLQVLHMRLLVEAFLLNYLFRFAVKLGFRKILRGRHVQLSNRAFLLAL